MVNIKPKIFIGSSTAGIAVAEHVALNLAGVGDCVLWKDPGIWEANKSTFDNLLQMSGYFDFGVFVATADDLTLSNEKLVIEPRDNVILEMALFLGALGKDKAFLLVEDGIKLPSDFNGIFMPRFDSTNKDSISNACKEYSVKIEEYYQFGYLSLYPTTALAIGYYKNFIGPLVDSLSKADPLEIDGVHYTDFKVKVVIPTDLEGEIKEKAAVFYKRNGFVENAIKTKFRKHPAWFQLDPSSAPHAVIYDMPGTLTGIDTAIEMVLRKGFQGRPKMQFMIEQKELNNFKRVLMFQIRQSAYAKSIVEVIDEF